MALQLAIDLVEREYKAGRKPSEIVDGIYGAIEKSPLNPIWISVVPRHDAIAAAERLENVDPEGLPLYGIPFAVKDNINVAHMLTTAGCPAFAYTPDKSAAVVDRLTAAGAILIGKTNMDQFATGLVGVRSPYGSCSCVFDDDYISGGSSSGSAVAVASGLVSFSLGTDTAGSGRVPAAFNNIVGLKPTRGAISASGVVPACRSLDCVSIFALTCSDADKVLKAARGFDAADSYSRTIADSAAPWLVGNYVVGIPLKEQQEFFGDSAAAQLYVESLNCLAGLGAIVDEFDYTPLQECASLLYAGPWVAERRAALGEFMTTNPEDIHPVVRRIIASSDSYSAVDAFKAQYRLEELRKCVASIFNKFDFLLLPTAGTIYTKAQVEADPVSLNSNLGMYTNFVNLLDLAALAIPAGFRPNGLPFGVTVIGKAGTERALLSVADRLHRALVATAGRTNIKLTETAGIDKSTSPPGCTMISVVGAHLSGQPLNWQLNNRGARLWKTTASARNYRLFDLPNTTPPKPGLVRCEGFSGPGIEMEVYAIPTEKFGSFVAEVPAPLGIGNVQLSDGSWVKGFICEPYATASALEITQFGGWRTYLDSKSITPR